MPSMKCLECDRFAKAEEWRDILQLGWRLRGPYPKLDPMEWTMLFSVGLCPEHADESEWATGHVEQSDDD